MNTPVKFQLAKLLKEKGFDKRTSCYYKKDMSFSSQEGYLNGREFNAPTITEVVMWLYEKYSIWIYVDSHEYGKWCYNYKFNRPHELSIKITENGQFSLDDFDSPTEAYEAAIKYTLNNLLKSI